MVDKKTILLIGNFLSEKVQGNRSVIEELSIRLCSKYSIVSASNYRNGILRGLHMLWTTLFKGNQCSLALIDFYSGRAFLWAEIVSGCLHLLQRPYVMVLRGGNLPEYFKRFPRRVMKCAQRASAVIAPSRYLVNEIKVQHHKTQIISNPIDIQTYTYKLREPIKPRIIWLRAFHELYNPSLAVSSLALLVRTYPDAKLKMIGPDRRDGSLERVKTASKTLNILHHTTFIEGIPKKDVPEAMHNADIFVNTANVDNTPVSVLEAMASGLCIISTNVGGIPYMLEDEKDALLVPRNDPKAMSRAIKRILEEPDLAKKLSENARKKVETCDWNIILKDWEMLISSLVNKEGVLIENGQ